MDNSTQCKIKIDSMHKYLPLLSALIHQLEKIIVHTPESTDKIKQLKELKKQLSDPKPGILLEELDKCEEILGTIFELHDIKALQENEEEEEDKYTVKSISKTDNVEKTVDALKWDETKKPPQQNTNEQKTLDEILEGLEESNAEVIEFSESDNENELELIVPDEVNHLVYNSFDTTDENHDNSEEHKNEDHRKEKSFKIELSNLQVSNKNKDFDEEIFENKPIDLERCDKNEKLRHLEIKENEEIHVAALEDISKEEIPVECNEFISLKGQSMQSLDPVHLVTTLETKVNYNKIKRNETILSQQDQKRSADEQSSTCITKKQKISILSIESDECNMDPLQIDKEFITTSFASNSNCTENNSDDDVLIIEEQNPPIIIDSEDDDPPIESIRKMPVKTNEFTIKSVHPCKFRSTELNQPKITKKLKLKPSSKDDIMKLSSPQNNFLSNIDKQKNTNPRVFQTTVGYKKTPIPNAFYDNQKFHENNVQNNIDAAHRCWLNNFLDQFCSPHNIVHNTSFLLLKSALHKDDFKSIFEQRKEIENNHTNTANRLLSQMQNIFYANGDLKKQILTYVGRKFCELAFVNILDRTIALTTHSTTNIVNSRTRISTTKFEVSRINILNAQMAATKTRLKKKDLINPNMEEKNIPKGYSISSLLRKINNDDNEYCPSRVTSQVSAEHSSGRSLRSCVRDQRAAEYSGIMSYDATDEDGNINNEKLSPQVQENREETNASADIELYIIQKRLAEMEECIKQVKTFHNAYMSNISPSREQQSLDPQQPKVSMCSNSNEISSGNDIFVISDDEEDVQDVEPMPHLIFKSSLTNMLKEIK